MGVPLNTRYLEGEVIRTRPIALLLALLVVGSGALLFAQDESSRRGGSKGSGGLPVIRPNAGNEPVTPPMPIAPPHNSKERNPQPALQVAAPAETDLLNFVVYALNGDEPKADGYTTELVWPVQPLQGDALPVGKYDWTCRVHTPDGWSDFFAPYWRFEVYKDEPPGVTSHPAGSSLDSGNEPAPIPPAPTPVSPQPGTKVKNGEITLVVTTSGEVDEYHFQVTRGDVGSPVWEGYTLEPVWPLVRLPLNQSGDFDWTCRVRLGVVWSDWFDPAWTFEVEKPDKQGSGELGHAIGPVKSVVVSPSPARAEAGIRLALARDCHVTAALYDAQGALVRTLAAGPLAAGSHSLSWNGRDDFGRRVGAGTYLCRITADDASGVVRVTISR